MNIIIEGCDGTGKSTLAKYLCDILGLRYWHESMPRTFAEYKSMLEYGGMVFDRFCLGQFIYNEEKDRKLTEQELTTLVSEIFPKTNTILIYVDCSTDTIIQRLIQRGEGNTGVRTAMEKWVKNIRGSYRELLSKIGVKYIEIDGGKQHVL